MSALPRGSSPIPGIVTYPEVEEAPDFADDDWCAQVVSKDFAPELANVIHEYRGLLAVQNSFGPECTNAPKALSSLMLKIAELERAMTIHYRQM